MKYFCKALKVIPLIAIVFVIGCGSSGVKNNVGDGKVEPQLLDTTPYLPVRTFDKKLEAYKPYEARQNPYLALKGRIDRDVVTKFIQARRLLRAKNTTKAKVTLGEITAMDKSLSGPWVMRGDIAVTEDKHKDAIALYKKAIQTNKSNVNAYLKLAKSQRVLGQFVPAQNTYAQALSLWPDFPEAHLNLGVLYDVYLNHPLRAQKHMQAYQFLTDGKNKQVIAWIGEIQQRTGVKTSLSTQQ